MMSIQDLFILFWEARLMFASKNWSALKTTLILNSKTQQDVHQILILEVSVIARLLHTSNYQVQLRRYKPGPHHRGRRERRSLGIS